MLSVTLSSSSIDMEFADSEENGEALCNRMNVVNYKNYFYNSQNLLKLSSEHAVLATVSGNRAVRKIVERHGE
jgi:hypothetical protein